MCFVCGLLRDGVDVCCCASVLCQSVLCDCELSCVIVFVSFVCGLQCGVVWFVIVFVCE